MKKSILVSIFLICSAFASNGCTNENSVSDPSIVGSNLVTQSKVITPGGSTTFTIFFDGTNTPVVGARVSFVYNGTPISGTTNTNGEVEFLYEVPFNLATITGPSYAFESVTHLGTGLRRLNNGQTGIIYTVNVQY